MRKLPLSSVLMFVSDLFKKEQNSQDVLLIFSKAQVSEN